MRFMARTTRIVVTPVWRQFADRKEDRALKRIIIRQRDGHRLVRSSHGED
jgi:hypothetical protein